MENRRTVWDGVNKMMTDKGVRATIRFYWIRRHLLKGCTVPGNCVAGEGGRWQD